MAFDPDAYLAEGGGVETATSFDPDAYLGTQQPAEEEGFLRQAADIPVNIFKGGVTGVRMVTDVFGAANPISKSLAGVEDYMDTLLSAQAKQDQQEIARILKDAEDKGVLDQVMAGVEAFSVAPADTLANAFGTMIPVLATGLAGSVARLAPVAIKGVQLGMGAAMGAGTIKGEIYNSVYSELENQGVDPETADKQATQAQAYGGKNLDQILLGAGLGAAAASTGAEKILTNVITKAGGKVSGGAIAKAIKGGITEAVPEAAQGGQEKLATNIALQREGVDVPTMRGVVAQATMEGVAGLGMGAAVGPLEPSLPDDVREQRDIERDTEKVARELSVDPNDSNARGIVNETNRLEQKIQNNQVLLNGMEPTSREHQRLSLEIAEDQKNLAALKGAVDKLSEPIAAAEAEQARLAREIAAPVEEAVTPTEPTAVAEATAPTVKEGLTVPPTEEVVTPPVEPTAAVEEAPIEPVAEATAITPAPVEEVEFAELRNLMERRGQAQGKVKGVKFSKKDEARYNELLPKYRSQLLETITPETDPVVWKDIEGNDIKVSQKGTFYTVENGRVRTGPAFQSEGFIKDVSQQPVSAAVVESNNVPLPEGYTKQGDLYVYQPTEAPTPTAPTPTAPAVGNRIKLGKSPQTYTIEEVIPQSEAEKELGEQYYSVKNEKTGEVQTVEAKDLKPVKAKGVRKMAARVKDESLVVPEADRYTFEQAEAEARKLFGGMPEGFIIVNDSVDPEYEFKAGYEPDTGDIILNLAYIRKGENVRNLIAHELGHYAAGDPEIRAKLQEFLDALPPVTRSRIERFVERFYNEDTGEMRLEEKQVRAFVQMLKKSENRNVFQKLLDAIKKWINDKLGTNFQPTDMDAAAVLSGAINRYKSGEKIAREDGEMREAKVERSEDVKKDIAIAKKIQSVVDETINKMPQDQARDYNAFVNEGKSEAQIAEENNTSVSQVRTNIVRGKKAVGDAIKKAKIDTKAKPENVVLEWTTSAAKKYLTKEGDLPGGTFQNWVKRNAKLAREAEEARQATQDFYEGLRKIYKINKLKFIWEGLSSIPPEDVARFNDALAGEIPINQMPTEIQEPLTRMRQHIDAMSSELIATGQLPEYLEAKAMNNLGVYLTRSYKIFSDPKWINKIPQEKLTAARNFLYQQQSKTDPNFTIEDADRKLEQMLNDWAGERGMEGKRGGRLGAKDLSVMMTRSEVPKQLRDVMGENTNVIFNYANTIAKISRFVADQQFLDAVKKEGAGKFLFTKDAAPKGFNTLIAPEESRTMAPLSGLRTTPEIAKAFEEFGKAYDAKANPFLYAFGWLNAVGKANLTVGSLFTQARNIIGQPFFFLANGHADLRAINREVERIMKSKGLSKDKARNELVKMAAGEGLVNENAYAGELKEAFEQIGLKTFEDMDADEFSRQFVLLRLFKKGTQGAQKVYQKTDELGKLIGWLNETNRIQKMNPSMSREDAMSIASERTRNTYPTYSQGSEALRLFRRQPFFGPFATFFYETFRTTYWNVVYAFQDINSGTEAGKQEGIKRLAGTMAQIAIGAYLVNAISAMVSGIGDQEEEDVRRMLPPWAANASLVWFPKTKDGVYDFINFSSLNPYNALSDPFVTMISGFSRGEDPTDIFINAAGTFLSPFTSEQPVTAATIDALRNVTERGTKVYNEEDDLGTKTSKILLHIFGKAFTPGTIDRLRKRIIPAIYGETVGTRAPAPYKEIGAEFTGVRFENLDMRQAFQNKAWEFNKAQNDSERIFRDVATRRRRVTEEEQVEAYRRAEESRYQNWQEMYRNYMAVRRAGASKEEAVRLMTDIKISKREASYIARGKYVPYEVSDEVRRRSKLNGNVVPLQEIKAIAKEMPRVLEDVQ